MIELGTLVNALSRLVVSAAARALGSVPVALTVVVPDPVPDEVAVQLAYRIGTGLRSRAETLGINRRWEPAVVRDQGQKVVVRLADRPVAVVGERYPAVEDAAWIDAVADAVDAAVRRRLSVLADVPALLASIGIREPTPAQIDAVGLLLDCGVSVGAVEREHLTGRAGDLGELLVEVFAPREIVLEVSDATARSVDSSALDDVIRLRARLYADTGVQIPDIRLVVLREPAGTVRIRLNDVVLRRSLDATAGWRDVVHALDLAVRESAFWFMRTSEVRATLAQLADTLPDLVGLVERSYSDPRLTGCLREILRQGDSARNMPRILWLLIQMVDDPDPLDVAITDPILLAGPAEVGRVLAAPAALAAAIRRVDAAETAGDGSGSAPGIVVPPEVESALRGPADSAVRAAAERKLLEVVMAEDEPTQVEVGHADAVPGVRAGLAPLPRPPRVVARQELPLRAPASSVRLETRPPG